MDESILYVDVENLQDAAQQIIMAAIEHWPEDFPRPKLLKLYVKADLTELWRIWASHKMPSNNVVIKGVQHYSYNNSKNSADIALALDALADVLKGRTQHVAVLSDDSDFATLFAAISVETNLAERLKVPFKWFMTNRPDTRSPILDSYFSSEYIHMVDWPISKLTTKETMPKFQSPPDNQSSNVQNRPIPSKPKKHVPTQKNVFEAEAIAQAIVKNMPLGLFKSTDCKNIIKQYFPTHPLAKADNAAFGNQFSKEIWPALEKLGVLVPNANRKPRKYEMTEDAKKKIG
jgi:hypothetical protein